MNESIFDSDEAMIRWRLRSRLAGFVNEMGQERVAKMVGTSQSNISQVLNNKNKPQIETLIRYLNRLGVKTTITITPY